MQVTIIGGGLAGVEAAYQLANQGVDVVLYEQRPIQTSKAHHTEYLSELVCSNSLRSNEIGNASGLLKEELRICGSLVMQVADKNKVPAGGALAVDREKFSQSITKIIEEHEHIQLIRQPVNEIPTKGYIVVATGPLTEGPIADSIRFVCGQDYFHFFDAAAPVVTLESINMEKSWWASRYDKGEKDYINCPLTEEEYHRLIAFLVQAKKHKPDMEGEEIYFEGCMPVEEMARRGEKTLAFGPLKPVGLIDPHTKQEPYAVVQLRIDNKEKTLFNLVGFQTSLVFSEQKKMLSLIPGLEEAEIVRYGVMHQNSYINSPLLLGSDGSLQADPRIYFAGQITGVEGYIESVASGLASAWSLAAKIHGQPYEAFPDTTAIGSLMRYISTSADARYFQPMNINWGIVTELIPRIRQKKLRNEALGKRALTDLDAYINRYRSQKK